MEYYTIKNLTIIDLDAIAQNTFNSLSEFLFNYSIEKQSDVDKLYSHFFFSDLLDTYAKRKTATVIFYHNSVLELPMSNNVNNIIKRLKDKFKFPTIECNFSISDYISLISDDSPEYDEAVNNNFNFIDSLGLFKKYVKRSGLVALEKKYNNLKNISDLFLN